MNAYRELKTAVLGMLCLVLIIGCSGGGGVDGSGGKPKTIITGTAAEGKALHNREVMVKGAKGNKTTGNTDDNGKFSIDVRGLEAPYILKIDDDQGKRLYSIATTTGVNNIHPFSNLVARNWFVSRGRFIDSEFDSDSAITNPPLETEVSKLIDAFKNLLRAAFQQFSIPAGFDFQHGNFDADSTGFDKMLDNILIEIKQDKLTIKLTDPDSGFQVTLILDFNLANDISTPDTQPPTTPTGLVAFPVNDTSVVVIWNPSTDNVGVAGYRLYRNNDAGFPITTPFPHFVDTGLTSGTQYCYSVEAFDGAFDGSDATKGVSPKTSPDVCVTPQTVTSTKPNTGTNLNATVVSDTEISLTWTPSTSDAVIGYDILRGPSGAVTNKIATVVPSSYLDFNLTASTEYCYAVEAFNASGTRSDPSPEVCATTNAADTIAPVSSADVPAGTYSTAQTVQLSCTDSGGSGCAATYYTTDGSDPDTGSALYSTALTIDKTTTLKFFSVDKADNSEAIQTVIYTINLSSPPNAPTVSGSAITNNVMPTWNWSSGGGGNGTYRFRIDNSDLTTGATTTTDTTFTPSSALAEGNHSLYVQEQNDNGDWSSSGSFTTSIDLTLPTASASLASGTYTGAQQVDLSCSDVGSGTCVIYYTLDGSDPTVSSTLYSGTINISSDTTLKFLAVDGAANSGVVSTENYVINIEPLSVDVSTSMSPVVSTDHVLFTITVSNTSAQPVNSIAVAYTLPTGIHFAYTTDADPNAAGCTSCVASNVAKWNLGTLNAGESRSIFVNAIIDTGLTDGTVITSPFEVTATELSSPIDISKTVEVYNNPSAQISLNASTGPVTPDQNFTYHVDIGDIAGTDLTGTVLRLHLPNGVSLQNSQNISNGGSVDPATGDVVWNINTFNVNTALSREVNVVANSNDIAGEVLTARAELSFDGGPTVDRAAEYTTTVTTTALPLSVDLSTTANPVLAGNRTYYAITVTNNSFQTVKNVNVMYRTPNGVSFAYTTDADPNVSGCTACITGNEASWNLGNLAAGDSRTILLNAKVDGGLLDGSLISAPVRVTADSLTQTISLRKAVAEYSAVSTQLSLGASTDSVIPGQTFSFNVDVGNISGAALTGVVLHTSLPSGVSVSSISDGGSELSQGEIEWNIGNLPVGANLHREISVLVTGSAKDMLAAKATLVHDGGLEVDAKAEHEVNVIGSASPLHISVDAANNPVVASGRLAYTITVNNASAQTVNAVSVLYRVPNGVSFAYTTDADPNVSGCTSCAEGNEASWNLGDLAAGESRTINLNARVNAGLVDGTLIAAPITVKATGLADDYNLTKTAAVYSKPSAQLAMSANADQVTSGSSFTYNIDVGNISGAALAGAQLRTRLPAGVTAVTPISDGGSVDTTNGDIVWDLGNLPVYANLHREITVTVGSGMSGKILTARSSLTYTGDLETDLVAEHSVSVAATAMPIQVDVDVAQSPAVPGGRLLYTFTVSNTSAQTVTAVNVLYRVPTGISAAYTTDADPNIGGCTNCVEGNEANWSLGDIAAGDSRTITLNANVDAGLVNGTLISAPVKVTAASINDIQLVKTVPVYNTPSLQMVMGADNDPVAVGGSFNYTIDVGNISGTDQTGVQLRTRLPAGITVNSISDGGSTDTNTGEIVWTLGTVTTAAAVHREINVTAASSTAGMLLGAQTRLTHDGGLETDLIAEHSVSVAASVLPLTVTASASPSPVVAGNTITYTYQVSNTSAQTVSAVNLQLRVPNGVTFNYITDANPNASGCTTCIAGNEANWALGDMAAGSSQTITVNATSSSALVGGFLITAPIKVTATGITDDINLMNVVPVQ